MKRRWSRPRSDRRGAGQKKPPDRNPEGAAEPKHTNAWSVVGVDVNKDSSAACGLSGLLWRLAEVLTNAFRDPVDVVDRLAKRRHSVVLPNVSLAGVVSRDCEVSVTVECIEQPVQVVNAAVDIGLGVIRVEHAEAFRGGRHELHQTASAFVRKLARVEIALRLNDRGDE